MTDTILLTIPRATRFTGVATRVLGGIGSRLDLPYERIDDLQLALLSVLDAGQDGDVSLEVETDGTSLALSIGPLVEGSSADASLARVLARLVDEVEPDPRDGEEWLTLRVTDARSARS
jgi:hypothetical protein